MKKLLLTTFALVLLLGAGSSCVFAEEDDPTPYCTGPHCQEKV